MKNRVSGRKKRSAKAGLGPGTLIHIGKTEETPVSFTLYRYTHDSFSEHPQCTFEEIAHARDLPGIKWIEVNGVHEPSVVQRFGELFKIHSLVLEDIVNTSQRPKREDYGTISYVVAKMIQIDKESRTPEFSQISLILGPDFVVSFEEGRKDCFDELRNRVKNGHGRIRSLGADYLLYSLLDAIVDNYFVVLEELGEELDEIEEELISQPRKGTLQKIYNTKRAILSVRRAVWPLRELLSSITRGESILIQKDILIYFRDVYDHVVEIIDIVENSREMIAGMIDVYLSSISNRLNEVMRVLTVITTIFMPLTFIAGVYGMNFRYMPELEWRHGYFLTLGLMFSLALSMVVYFRARRWL